MEENHKLIKRLRSANRLFKTILQSYKYSLPEPDQEKFMANNLSNKLYRKIEAILKIAERKNFTNENYFYHWFQNKICYFLDHSENRELIDIYKKVNIREFDEKDQMNEFFYLYANLITWTLQENYESRKANDGSIECPVKLFIEGNAPQVEQHLKLTIATNDSIINHDNFTRKLYNLVLEKKQISIKNTSQAFIDTPGMLAKPTHQLFVLSILPIKTEPKHLSYFAALEILHAYFCTNYGETRGANQMEKAVEALRHPQPKEQKYADFIKAVISLLTDNKMSVNLNKTQAEQYKQLLSVTQKAEFEKPYLIKNVRDYLRRSEKPTNTKHGRTVPPRAHSIFDATTQVPGRQSGSPNQSTGVNNVARRLIGLGLPLNMQQEKKSKNAAPQFEGPKPGPKP